MTRASLFLVLALSLAVSGFSTPSPSSAPSDADIRSILVQRIDTFHQGIGIVVGVIDPAGRRIVAYGSLNQGDARPLNCDTVFEIGSVTKVFTSLLLADMIERHEVALNDPISKYLPVGVKAPEHDGRSITLLDLATHTSGLPRLPANLHPKEPANPYADYTAKDHYAFLSSYQLTRDPGAQFEYSNLGGGLLGYLLSLRAGTGYEALVHARITGPLSMTRTGITLTPDERARLAVGHNDELKPVVNWDFNVLVGAGALRSSANDLLTFLAAFLGYKGTPLAPAMASMLVVHRTAPSLWLRLSVIPVGDIGLAWIVAKSSGIVSHSGGTGGYRSFVGFDPKTRAGVVVLSNTFTIAGVDDIGMHLLDPQAPLMTPPKEHKEISLDPKISDGYVGRYQLAPNFVVTITREGDALFAEATGQFPIQIFPEDPRDFFFKIVDAQITFETDANGRATSLTLHQNGNDVPATRIGDVGPPK